MGASAVEYRRPHSLTTRLLGRDERWFYLEQRFVRGGTVAAVPTVRAAIRGAAGAVSTAEALAAVGIAQPSSALPGHVAALVRARPQEDYAADGAPPTPPGGAALPRPSRAP